MTPEEFKEARKKLGLTQAGLAEQLGVIAGTVNRWENGVRAISPIAISFIKLLLRLNKNN